MLPTLQTLTVDTHSAALIKLSYTTFDILAIALINFNQQIIYYPKNEPDIYGKTGRTQILTPLHPTEQGA